MEYHSSFKRKELLIDTTTCMDIEGRALCRMKQKPVAIDHILDNYHYMTFWES
jgi:hypothetical protein